MRSLHRAGLLIPLALLALCAAAQPDKQHTKVLLARDRMAAQWDTVDVVKNVVKLNPLLFFRGEVPVYYERVLSYRLSAELGLGFTWRNYISLPINGDDADAFSAGTRIVAKPSFHLGFRYYLQDDLEPQGTYAQVDFAYLNYTKFMDTKDSSGYFTGNELKDERIFNDLRLLVGYQKLSGTSNWLFDFYGGLGLRARSLIKVNENYNTVTDRFTYAVEDVKDLVPAVFLGVKVGVGW